MEEKNLIINNDVFKFLFFDAYILNNEGGDRFLVAKQFFRCMFKSMEISIYT